MPLTREIVLAVIYCLLQRDIQIESPVESSNKRAQDVSGLAGSHSDPALLADIRRGPLSTGLVQPMSSRQLLLSLLLVLVLVLLLVLMQHPAVAGWTQVELQHCGDWNGTSIAPCWKFRR